MKTIAISIDEQTINSIDEALKQETVAGKNRSQVIRQAVREYLADIREQSELGREREIFRRHRKLLKRQAIALMKGQAKP